MRRIKNLIKLKFLKLRMNWLHKRWIILRNKESKLHQKYNVVSTNFYCANQNLHLEEIWDMRAEKETQRHNH